MNILTEAMLALPALVCAILIILVLVRLFKGAFGKRQAVKRIFVICPVRNVDAETNEAIRNYIHGLEERGYKVHWPFRDTNQNDPVGLNICSENREAIYLADEVHIWFDVKSQGSLFDIGITFAFIRDLDKKVVIINKDQVLPTPHKSFQNVLLALEKMSR